MEAPTMTLRPLIPCLLVAAAAACEATPRETTEGPVGEPGARAEGGGGLNEMLSRNRGAHVRGQRLEERRQQGAADLPRGWKEKIEAWWNVWRESPQDLDPTLATSADEERLLAARVELRRRWVAARSEWVSLGPGAVSILVENLLNWYVRAYDANAGAEVERAKLELGLFRQEAIAYVVEGLARNMGDSIVRTRLGELIASFGDEPVPVIEAAFAGASEDGRVTLVKALKQIRSTEAAPFLQRIAADDGAPWRIRIEAIGALGKMAARTAGPVLRSCLTASDHSVRKFAALHMHAVTDGGMADKEALVDAMSAALDDGDQVIADACRRSLSAMTGRRLALDPVRWRAVIRRGPN